MGVVGQEEQDKIVMEVVQESVAELLIVLHGHQSVPSGDIAKKIIPMVILMLVSVDQLLIVPTGLLFAANGVTVRRVEVVEEG